MLPTLLTIMTFILPFLITHPSVTKPGLHLGLWLSLFTWGQIHPLFSILVFTICLCHYIVQKPQENIRIPSSYFSVYPHLVYKSGTRPLVGFLSVMVMFCAFGNACTDYGSALSLPPMLLEISTQLPFFSSMLGSIFFGWLYDNIGIFPAYMTLHCFAIAGLGLTALSQTWPITYFIGIVLVYLSASGIFVLTPLMLLHFFGRTQLPYVMPLLLIFFVSIWSISHKFHTALSAASTAPQDLLLSMGLLLIAALPLARKAWKNRLAILYPLQNTQQIK